MQSSSKHQQNCMCSACSSNLLCQQRKTIAAMEQKSTKKPDGVNKSFVTYRVLVILHVQHHMAKRFCSACIVNLFESRIHRGCFRLIRLHTVAVVIVANLQFLYRCSKVLTILFIRVISIRFI